MTKNTPIIVTTNDTIKTEIREAVKSEFKLFIENEKINKPIQKYLPPKEAADYFYTDIQTLNKYAKLGFFKKHYFGGRSVRYDIQDIEAYIESNTEEKS